MKAYIVYSGLNNDDWIIDSIFTVKQKAISYLNEQGLKYSSKYSLYYGYSDKRKSNIFEDSDIYSHDISIISAIINLSLLIHG